MVVEECEILMLESRCYKIVRVRSGVTRAGGGVSALVGDGLYVDRREGGMGEGAINSTGQSIS